METPSEHWSRWCMLCAKYDPDNSFEFQNGALLSGLSDDIKLTIKQAIEQYLYLKASDECIPAKSMCYGCYSYLVAHIKFSQRVQRVQEMFKFLELTPIEELCDLESVRLKFNVTADGTLSQPTDPEYSFAKSVYSPVEIKQEISGPEEFMDTDEKELSGLEEFVDDNESRLQNEDDLPHCDDDNQNEFSLKSKLENETSNLIRKTLSVDSSVKRGKVRSKRKGTTSRGKQNIHISKDFPLDVSCLECNEKFALYSYYYEHVKLRHANSVKDNLWKCPDCGSILRGRHSFRRHMKLHMPAERLPIKCPQCDNRYQTDVQLEKHIKQKHCNVKPYICEECGIGISTSFSLKRHMDTYHPKKHVCSICGLELSSRTALRRHCEVHSNDMERGIGTTTLSSLTHSNLTPAKCKICEKNFKGPAHLKRHMGTHDPKKLTCNTCGLKLSSRETLRRHFLVHSNDMQHKCDYCGRAFKRSRTLKSHLLLHIGLKPYSCDFCDSSFVKSSACRRHMKNVHPIELASLEASGGRIHTPKIPKLENLKALIKTPDHLWPVTNHSIGSTPVDSH